MRVCNNRTMGKNKDMGKNNTDILDFETIAQSDFIENELLQQADADGIEDLKQASINEFKAVLYAVGSRLFPRGSKVLRIDNNIFYNESMNLYSNNNQYDFYKIYRMCEIYVYLSNKYKKLISKYYYCLLINVSITHIDDLLNRNINNNIDTYLINNSNSLDNNTLYILSMYSSKKLNSLRLEVAQMLDINRHNNIKERCFESNSAVGYIALGNVEYRWNQSADARAINTTITSINELPQLEAPQIAQKSDI